jgi:hypothetical protein
MRASPPLPFRLWRIAAGTSAAIQTAAVASDFVLRRLQPSHLVVPEYRRNRAQPTEGEQIRSDKERLELVREIQACDVRLDLLPPGDNRSLELRSELEERRARAAERLAEQT